MKYLKTFESLKHTELEELSNSFVNNLTTFKDELLSDKNTIESDGVIITNDTIFYFLIGKYISMNRNFVEIYDELSTSDQEEVDELNTNKICDKFNVEF